jgi:hypothetical protein
MSASVQNGEPGFYTNLPLCHLDPLVLHNKSRYQLLQNSVESFLRGNLQEESGMDLAFITAAAYLWNDPGLIPFIQTI